MTVSSTQTNNVRFLAGVSSYQNAVAVTTSDTVDLTTVASALYVGVSGDVKVDLEGSGTGIVFKDVPIGLLKCRIKRVYANGTDATDIVALW